MQTVYLVLAAILMTVWLLLAILGPRSISAPGMLAVLRFGPMLRSLALGLALVGPLIMIYAIWNFPWRTEARLNIAGVSFLLTSIIMALPLVEVARTQVVISEEGVARFSPWSGPVSIKWGEIERIRYSAVNRWFIVEGAGRRVRIARDLIGIHLFADLAKRKLATAIWAGAADALR